MSQQPTFHITKEHFVGVINSLHEQFVKDKQRSEAITEIFNAEAAYYDNSALINAVFSFLHEVFPKDENGNCDIKHYCYVLSFGKNGEEYESPEELYDRLIAEKIKGNGIMYQIENNQTFLNGDRDIHGSFGKVLSDICYPIAPEDAFVITTNMTSEFKPSPDENA